MRYKVQWNYKSSFGGPWMAGDVIEVSIELAGSINRDSPGVLAPDVLPLEPVEERALEAPPQDRMVRHGVKRGQHGR